jgi:methylmalonyl-CoA epimerase
MKIKKMNHVGIVVRNLDEALEAYSRGFGVEVEKTMEVPNIQLKIGILRIGGMEIELLHYQNPDHPLVKPLQADRMGIHHLCYEVENIEEALETLQTKGFKLVEGFPRKGAHGKIAFLISPHSTEEKIEILETEPKK